MPKPRKKRQHPAWGKATPTSRIGKAIATVGVLKTDAAYAKAMRSGNRTEITAAASRMRTAQKRAGHATAPKLRNVGDAVRAKAAYDQALASGDPKAIRAAATRLAPFQPAAGIQRDRRGRFT